MQFGNVWHLRDEQDRHGHGVLAEVRPGKVEHAVFAACVVNRVVLLSYSEVAITQCSSTLQSDSAIPVEGAACILKNGAAR